MQTSFGVNVVALVDGVPRTLSPGPVRLPLRRSPDRGGHPTIRVPVREGPKPGRTSSRGLLRAIDMLDAVIAAIRASDDRPAAREALMAEPFSFSEDQAVHILDMTLGRLTRLGRAELEEEMAKLRETIAELEAILGDPAKLRAVISEELTEIKTKYANPRRTVITHDPGEMGVEDLIEDEELVVTMTRAGYIKAVLGASFRTQGRGGRGVQGARLKEEDLVAQLVHTSAHAYLLLFSNRGRVYRLRAHEVPMKERTARGTAVVNLLPLAPDETIQAIVATRDFDSGGFLTFATKAGQVKKTAFTEYDKSRREGFIAIALRDGDELVRVVATSGDDDVVMVSHNGSGIRFSEHDVRPMGRDAAGVRGMRSAQWRRGRVVGRGPARCRRSHRDRRRLRQADQDRPLRPYRAAAARECGP
jgi:DNA gyrase subunit A